MPLRQQQRAGFYLVMSDAIIIARVGAFNNIRDVPSLSLLAHSVAVVFRSRASHDTRAPVDFEILFLSGMTLTHRTQQSRYSCMYI